MDFSYMLKSLKNGDRAKRKGWNGKDMFIYYVPVGAYKPCTPIAEKLVNDNGLVEYGDYIAIKTAQGNVIPWTPSQADILSCDWYLLPMSQN